MNKKVVRIVIFLSGISLVGIVALQFIWFHKMLEMREDQFDRDVKAALQETAKRIEKDEGLYFLADRLKNITNVDTMLSAPITSKIRDASANNPPPKPKKKKIAKPNPVISSKPTSQKLNGFYSNSVVIVSNGRTDTVFSSYQINIGPVSEIVQSPEEQFIFPPNNAGDWFYEQQMMPPPYEFEATDPNQEKFMMGDLNMMRHLDSIRMAMMHEVPLSRNHPGFGKRPEPPRRDFSRGKADPEKEKLNNQIQKLEKQKNKLNDALSRMMVEIKGIQSPAAINLNIPGTRDILSSELSGRNISIPFEYVVISGTTDTISRSPGYKHDFNSTLYQANLFTDRIFEASDRIALYFPQKQNMLFRSMLWLMLASLFFTLIIVSTFIVSILVIIRQKKMSEVKSDFINNMTHEFKTPIATISLAADSIVNPRVMSDPERIHYYTRVIKEENKRMNNQVESVLQMALLDKKDFGLNLQPLDIHDLINQAIQNISLQIEKRGGQITSSLDALDSTAMVDEVHFLNVLFNLLDNANKYSPVKPEIDIRTFNNDQKLLIQVTDKGMGMDKDTKSRIFEKFYRRSTGNIHNVKGFGLGLSYVKAIVLATNGDIRVESEPEKGSCFTIEIPVYNGN